MRDIIDDDAPMGIVIDAHITVDQAVTGSYNLSPGYRWMTPAHRSRYMGRRLTNQFEVANDSVVPQLIALELCLIRTCAVSQYLRFEGCQARKSGPRNKNHVRFCFKFSIV